MPRALWLAALAAAVSFAVADAQPAPPARPPGPPNRGPQVVSPEVSNTGRVTFRILAPNAAKVTLSGEVGFGLPGQPAPPPPGGGFSPPPAPADLVKGADGIWVGETREPIRPGAYRYSFSVDGVTTLDSRNQRTSPSQAGVQSLLVVPGDFSEQRNVPHGALARVGYEAKSYGPGVQREVFVYTPPGYEKSSARYPVLYLLHGGGDTAESWATVGRANFILDNLIAEKKATPFILVMMSGWTPRGPQSESIDAAKDPFNAEFVNDIIPMIESRYRVVGDPAHRALSGLSMGGFQTLTLGIKNVDKFAYVLPMSTGWFTDDQRAAYVAANRAELARADRQLKLFWWGWGKVDIARENGLKGMAAIKAAGLTKIETYETPYGHDWASWRLMLHEIASKLFR